MLRPGRGQDRRLIRESVTPKIGAGTAEREGRWTVPSRTDAGCLIQAGAFGSVYCARPTRLVETAYRTAAVDVQPMATCGAPAVVTLSELAIELSYPLDEFTATALRGLVVP